MNNGYMGRILFVNLSTSEITEEPLEEKICRDFIGGYGGRRQLLLPVNDNYICRFPSFLFWSFLLSGLRCWAAAVR